MSGVIRLYSGDDNLIETAMYKNAGERKRVMAAFGKVYDYPGYYFIVSPIVFEKLSNVYTLALRKVKRVPKKVETTIVRPIASYNNIKSHYGISDELHKQIIQ